MEFEIQIAGDVIERQELLNGTQLVTLEGASADGQWTMVGGVSWNIGLEANTNEGDITLSRADGTELFGTLSGGDVQDTGGAADADYRLSLAYEVDGGSGAYAGASGSARAEGLLVGDSFRLCLGCSLRGRGAALDVT